MNRHLGNRICLSVSILLLFAAEHLKEMAGIKDFVAVFCGKFSSAFIESMPLIHEQRLVLLDPWAVNDKLIENGYSPSYAFRLSLKDSWAVPAMMGYARKRGFPKVELLMINTSWGRSRSGSRKAAPWTATPTSPDPTTCRRWLPPSTR